MHLVFYVFRNIYVHRDEYTHKYEFVYSGMEFAFGLSMKIEYF